MWKYINERTSEVFSGGIFGGVAGSFVFVNTITVLTYIGSLLTVILSAAVGALATVLITDYYKYKIKPKLYKTKEDGQADTSTTDKAA
jgi:uncharacterized membrane protein